jgi:hypothetical protein
MLVPLLKNVTDSPVVTRLSREYGLSVAVSVTGAPKIEELAEGVSVSAVVIGEAVSGVVFEVLAVKSGDPG